MYKRLFNIALIIFLFSIAIFPQKNTDIKKAEELVTKGLGFVKSADWTSYAKLLDPADLKMLKETFNNLAKEDSTDEIVKSFEGVGSKEKFLALSGEEFFPYFMKFLVLVQTGLSNALSSIDAKILGSIKEDNMIHVLTRQTSSLQANYSQLEVITVVKKDSNSYIRMKDDIRMLAEQLKRK